MNFRFNDRIRLTPEMLKLIARIDELKGLWRGSAQLNPHVLKQLKASVIITSTGASTRIEGSQMSDAEVERLIRGLNAKSPKGRDAEEVAGYADLLGRIFDNHKTFKLTEGQILQFHNILLQFSTKDRAHKGRYKSADNIVVARGDHGEEIVLFRPTPPYLVKKEMDDVLAWTHTSLKNRDLHPLLIIANFIFEFLAIHPFHDGNGRLSRALTNLLLLQTGYEYIPYVSLEEIIEGRKDAYYFSLRGAQRHHKTEREDISTWIVFLLEALVTQAEEARMLIERDDPERMLSERQLAVFALFTQEVEFTPREIVVKTEIPLPTVKQVLARLLALKLVKRIGLGRATRYRKS
ncbi:Fic family protein [Candidatus Kaiserbacteria bacterium]|nr:Fic family protein [Candidatus Kaiserbacteria bacterium]